MTALRWLTFACILIGGACLAGAVYVWTPENWAPVHLPLPGAGLAVAEPFRLSTPGGYLVQVTVPGEPSPTLDCDLTVTIEGPGSGRQVKDLRSVRHAGSYSFGGLQHYNSEPFQLGSRGEYVFRIASRSDAPAMRARGATVTLTQYYHPTEWVLAAGLSRVAGFALIAVGAIGSLWSAILGMRRERQAA